MIRRLELTPEVLLHLTSGCVQVIADPIPDDARLVGYGANTSRGLFYVDIESTAFTNETTLTPTLQRCEKCSTE